LLRSQAGVDEVESPYENLKQGLIKVKVKKDVAVDLAGLVEVLEKQIGFEPLTEVKVELTGRLEKQKGKLVLEANGTGQRFQVAATKFKGPLPAEKDVIVTTATLKGPRSADRIVLWDWKPVDQSDRTPR
jgi:hypothetical protein